MGRKSVAGLMIAWRWERLGAWVAILTLVVRELLYLLVYREWVINFLLIWLVILPPALIYLLVWRKEKMIRLPEVQHQP